MSSKKLLTLSLVVFLNLLAFYVTFAWTEPSSSPPGNNVPKLLNASSTSQIKEGDLTVNGTFKTSNIDLNATGSEGSIFYADLIRGSNDLRLQGDSNNQAAIYLTGSGDSQSDSRRISFYINNGTEAVRIDNSGKVGIGTTSPSKKLDINGGVRIRTLNCSTYTNGGKITTDANGNLTCADDTGGGGGGCCNLQSTTDVGNTTTNSVYVGSSLTIGYGQSSGTLYLADSSSEEGDIKRVDEIVGYNDLRLKGDSSESSPIYMGASRIQFYTNSTERMRIDNSGKVGIGTTSPSKKLDINGGVRIRTLNCSTYTNGGKITTDANGNLTCADDTGGGGGCGDVIKTISADSGSKTASGCTDSLTIVGGSGISTSISGSTLTITNTGIQGSISSGQVAFGTGTDTIGGDNNLYWDNSNKRLGIGTTSPSQKLHLSDGTLLIDNPASPTLVGSYDTPGYAYEVYVSGKYAYVADLYSGLQIIDISNPSSPTLVGSYNTPASYAQNVYVSGKYAYVADGNSGLQIIDISNPSSPTLVGSYNTLGFARRVYVSGKYAYVADDWAGLQIIDISNPSSPTLVGSYDTSGNAEGVYVSGKYAYVAGWDAGFQIIDISNPSSPTLVGSYNTPGYAHGVYVSGKYAYVADYTSGLQIINISNPSSPTLVGSYNTPSYAENVYVSGKYAYVADGTSGLQIIDISNPSSPTLVGSYDTPDYAWGVYVSGKYAYVADSGSGLQIIDIKGADIHALSSGNIWTNDITVSENIDVGNNLYIRNGLNVGPGGILTDGRLSASGISFQSPSAPSSPSDACSKGEIRYDDNYIYVCVENNTWKRASLSGW